MVDLDNKIHVWNLMFRKTRGGRTTEEDNTVEVRVEQQASAIFV